MKLFALTLGLPLLLALHLLVLQAFGFILDFEVLEKLPFNEGRTYRTVFARGAAITALVDLVTALGIKRLPYMPLVVLAVSCGVCLDALGEVCLPACAIHAALVTCLGLAATGWAKMAATDDAQSQSGRHSVHNSSMCDQWEDLGRRYDVFVGPSKPYSERVFLVRRPDASEGGFADNVNSRPNSSRHLEAVYEDPSTYWSHCPDTYDYAAVE